MGQPTFDAIMVNKVVAEKNQDCSHQLAQPSPAGRA